MLKKREKKQASKSSHIKETCLEKSKWKKVYHCQIPLKDGSICEVKTMNVSKMRTHLHTKFHFGPDYVVGDSFPEGVSQCKGKECDICKK